MELRSPIGGRNYSGGASAVDQCHAQCVRPDVRFHLGVSTASNESGLTAVRDHSHIQFSLLIHCSVASLTHTWLGSWVVEF